MELGSHKFEKTGCWNVLKDFATFGIQALDVLVYNFTFWKLQIV